MTSNPIRMGIKKIIRYALINCLVFFVFLEVCSFAYIILKRPSLEKFQTTPSYIFFSLDDLYATEIDPLGPHFIDSTYPWGTWHPRNSRFRQKKSCFDFVMHFNEEGTRGDLPDKKDTNTVIFLGDSFTEGWGLPDDSTIPSNYSKIRGVPVLNLGTSGHFGTTQSSLVYRYFSERFRHRRVFVILYLANDLIDNNHLLYDTMYSALRKYRPYRSDTSDLSKITYKGSPDSSLHSWAGYKESRAGDVRRLIRKGLVNHFKSSEQGFLSSLFDLTYSARLLEALEKTLASPKRKSDNIPNEILMTETEFRILDYDIGEIIDFANRNGAAVTFTNIPSRNCMDMCMKDTELRKRYFQIEAMLSESANKGPHRFVSFFQYILDSKTRPNSLFLNCDPHLNTHGSRMMSEFLSAQSE